MIHFYPRLIWSDNISDNLFGHRRISPSSWMSDIKIIHNRDYNMTSFTETCDTCAQINAYVTYYCFIDKIAYSQILEDENWMFVRGHSRSNDIRRHLPPNQLPRVLWDRFKELVPLVGRDMASNRSGASSIIFTIIVSIYAFKSLSGINGKEFYASKRHGDPFFRFVDPW